MDYIYPRTPKVVDFFVLTEEEKKTLKTNFVFAIEEGITTQQDRALRALELAEFSPERSLVIREHLSQIFDLEKEVCDEVVKDLASLEVAYEDGADDPKLLEEVITCEVVDKEVFAQRFVDAKAEKPEASTPVLPIKKIVEAPLEEGEIIKG